MAKPIMVKITGDASGFKKALGDAEQKLGSFVSGIATKGVAIAGALTAAGGALAVSGVKAFADFDTKMREVLTLLPGAGQETFDELSGQVKTFANEFGVLPDEVVPALYQALSAGVPKDNVFEFLEVAQQAAKGGVTDLATAVDGISSVVNAYGSEVISAAEASDLMFTAVRLGKTDFSQLSASLFNIAPIASALGVEFENVTAAVASLTAKGTPTSVVTTQLRAALSELAKEGTKVSNVFTDQTGQSFTEFMNTTNEFGRENTLFDALAKIAKGARETDTAVLDLFGSVEAGQAVLGLLSDESFGDNLGAMGQSAGATAAAFETMDSSMSSSFARIRAAIATTTISIGEALAPTVSRIADIIQDKVLPAVDMLTRVFGETGIVGVFKLVTFYLKGQVGPAFDAIKGWIGGLAEWLLSDGLPMLYEKTTALGEALIAWIGPRIQPAISALLGMLETLGNWMIDTGLPMMVDRAERWGAALVEWIGPQVGPALEKLGEWIVSIADWFINTALPTIIDETIKLGDELVGWIGPRIPDLLAALGEFLTTVLTWFVEEALPVIIEEGTKLGAAMIQWLSDILPELEAGLKTLTGQILEWGATTGVPAAYETGKQIGSAIIDGWLDALVNESSKLAKVAEYVPILGGLVSGLRGAVQLSGGTSTRQQNLRAFGSDLGIPAAGQAMDRATRSADFGFGAPATGQSVQNMPQNIVVNVATSASPHDIAREVAWVMSTGG